MEQHEPETKVPDEVQAILAKIVEFVYVELGDIPHEQLAMAFGLALHYIGYTLRVEAEAVREMDRPLGEN